MRSISGIVRVLAFYGVFIVFSRLSFDSALLAAVAVGLWLKWR